MNAQPRTLGCSPQHTGWPTQCCPNNACGRSKRPFYCSSLSTVTPQINEINKCYIVQVLRSQACTKRRRGRCSSSGRGVGARWDKQRRVARSDRDRGEATAKERRQGEGGDGHYTSMLQTHFLTKLRTRMHAHVDMHMTQSKSLCEDAIKLRYSSKI